VKRRIVTILAVLMVLLGSAVPSDAASRGGHSHRGFHHGGRCCWWGPGLFVGGLALGAALSYPYYAYPYPAYPAPVPPVVYEGPPVQPPAAAAQPPLVQREVVYPNGKYVLYGDGVTQPWQWVWFAAAPPGPPAPPPPPR
jgi:hypothetical protein